MIDSKEISVIVQGPIHKGETQKCLASIRKYLPEAEIILSTWEGSDVSGLDYDKIIYNEDPGSVLIKEYQSHKAYNNLNRQLLSTKEGLKLVTGNYTLKLRSDLILTGTGFIEYFDKFQTRIDDYKLFERKVVTSTLFTRYSIKCKKERLITPFHISDWWFFGLTKDLKTYFDDTELVKEPEFTNYFNSPEHSHKKNPYLKSKFQFSPEQYYGYKCFSRNFPDIRMDDAADINDEINSKSQICLVNNFIVIEFKQSGIYLNKYPFSKEERLSGDQYLGLYNFYKYETLYKKLCDTNYEVTTSGFIYDSEICGFALLRFYKHIFILTDSKSTFLKKLEQLFIGIPASLVVLIKEFLFNLIKR